jgi:hypothetical protein
MYDFNMKKNERKKEKKEEAYCVIQSGRKQAY